MIPKNFHSFIAYAKICSSKMALKYVNGVNVGKNMDESMDRLLLLRSYINSLENYQFPCQSEFIHKGFKISKSKRVILSKKNSLFLKSEDMKIRIDTDSLNCLTMKDLCLMADKIRSICNNC